MNDHMTTDEAAAMFGWTPFRARIILAGLRVPRRKLGRAYLWDKPAIEELDAALKHWRGLIATEVH